MTASDTSGSSEEALPNDSQLMTVALVGAEQEVLELGCSAGHVTRRLVANGCRVTGVEIDPALAAAAEEFAESVTVADLDLTPPHELFPGRCFPRIVVGDVFEHLKGPRAVLESLAGLLAEDGLLITSIPNVTHVDVALLLLSGAWRYQDGGLLDRTHLRFFDARGVDELFAGSGFTIVRVERTVKEPFASELAPLLDRNTIPAEAVEFALSHPEARTYQFVVVARPQRPDSAPTLRVERHGEAAPDPAAASLLGRLWEENEHLRTRVRALGEEVEQARWELASERAARPSRRLRAGLSRLLDRVRAAARR